MIFDRSNGCIHYLIPFMMMIMIIIYIKSNITDTINVEYIFNGTFALILLALGILFSYIYMFKKTKNQILKAKDKDN
jgi:hypothetical protein